MDYRTLDLTLISAKGLKKFVTLFGKSDVYAVGYVYGTCSIQKFTTPVSKNGGSNPTWNFPMKFTVNYAAVLRKRVGIVVKIKAVGIFSDKKFGEVRQRCAVKVLKDVPTDHGKGQEVSSFLVRTPSGKPKGYLTFSYRFGGKFSGNVEETVNPPVVAVRSSSTSAAKSQSYQPPASTGHSSQKGSRNPAVHRRSKKKKPGKVSRGDLSAGAVIGMSTTDAGGGCGGDGGGCGAGGCGGGECGGGGCTWRLKGYSGGGCITFVNFGILCTIGLFLYVTYLMLG